MYASPQNSQPDLWSLPLPLGLHLEGLQHGVRLAELHPVGLLYFNHRPMLELRQLLLMLGSGELWVVQLLLELQDWELVGPLLGNLLIGLGMGEFVVPRYRSCGLLAFCPFRCYEVFSLPMSAWKRACL